MDPLRTSMSATETGEVVAPLDLSAMDKKTLVIRCVCCAYIGKVDAFAWLCDHETEDNCVCDDCGDQEVCPACGSIDIHESKFVYALHQKCENPSPYFKCGAPIEKLGGFCQKCLIRNALEKEKTQPSVAKHLLEKFDPREVELAKVI